MLTSLNPFLAGAILMGCWAVALFFVRFFKRTGDRLFICFAIAFFLMGAEKLLTFWKPSPEIGWSAYLMRLAAFLLIAFGIIIKNRAKSGKKRQKTHLPNSNKHVFEEHDSRV